MRRLSLLVLAFALLAAACGGDGADDTTTTLPPGPDLPDDTTTTLASGSELPEIDSPAYLDFRAQTVACGADVPSPARFMQFTAPEDQGISDTVVAILHTSCGPVTIELLPDIAPQAVNSFVFLARQGYFDGTASHRILPGFVIQAGDPTATGMGRPGPEYTLPDELPEPGFLYGPGVVAMANSGPNSAGSQFFIVIGETGLGPDYTVFGRVVDGDDALERIASVPLGPNIRGEISHPLESVFIESVMIEP